MCHLKFNKQKNKSLKCCASNRKLVKDQNLPLHLWSLATTPPKSRHTILYQFFCYVNTFWNATLCSHSAKIKLDIPREEFDFDGYQCSMFHSNKQWITALVERAFGFYIWSTATANADVISFLRVSFIQQRS